jgi:nucleotide-binding universal stress UspA family protein
MILICYDGSADADAAVDAVAAMMPGQRATLLTVWEPFVEVVTRAGPGLELWPADIDHQRIDAAAEAAATERAEQGAERARNGGMDRAQGIARPRGITIAETIMEEARTQSASLIVIGTRGLTGVKSMVLGSVSHAVLQHADRPVMIVPSAEVAAKRAAHAS